MLSRGKTGQGKPSIRVHTKEKEDMDTGQETGEKPCPQYDNLGNFRVDTIVHPSESRNSAETEELDPDFSFSKSSEQNSQIIDNQSDNNFASKNSKNSFSRDYPDWEDFADAVRDGEVPR